MGSKSKKTDTYEHIEEEEEALESFLTPLVNIKGCKTAIVMTSSGEIMAINSGERKFDIHRAGLVFNDIFLAAHEAAEKIGIGECLETSIKAPKGIIVMRCSGPKSLVHFHLITILSADGNQALIKMELDKVVPLIANFLI